MQPGEISRENAHTRRVWELTLLSGLACLGFGVAWVQDDSVAQPSLPSKAAFAAAEALYLSV